MKKILIFKVGALGDVVRTIYILPGLKQKYENVKIYWITSNRAIDLLKNNRYIDILISLDDKDKILKLQEVEFDMIISLEDEEELFNQINRLKTKKIVGVYRKEGKITYTNELSTWFDMGLISKYGKEKADILKKKNRLSHFQIFKKGLKLKIEEPYFENDIKIFNRIKEEVYDIRKNYTIIGLNLNAGKRWPSKALKLKEGKKLIVKLLEDTHNYIFILGGKDDLEYNKKLIDGFENYQRLDFIMPTSLQEFSSIIGNLDILICSDTLALHLAISQKIRTISYYAPTSAAEIEVFGLGEKVISTSEDYCTYKPIVDNSSITAERIYEKFLNLKKKITNK